MARGLRPACRETRDEMNRDQGRVPILEINSFLRTRDGLSPQRREKETRKEANSHEISPPSRRKGTTGIGNEVLKPDEWSAVIREIGDDSFRVDKRMNETTFFFGRVLFTWKKREKEREKPTLMENLSLYSSFEEFKTSSIFRRDFIDSDSIYLEINVIHFTVLR